MCAWRGLSAFLCYMWGVKLYKLCKSCSGYVCNLEVMRHAPGVSNKPLDVCFWLLEPFANSGYTLFVDNYYCNLELAETLSAENTAVAGTVWANHIGLPKDLAQVLYVHWKDKRDVHMLPTKHLPKMTTVRSRTEEKRKPVCIVDYTANMAGVDKFDQMISYLPFHHKTVKWRKKLVLHLLTLVMIQAHTFTTNKAPEQQ